jgi:hypothetical protein
MGVQGPVGPAGPPGPQGTPGAISDVYSQLSSTASVTLSSAGFTDMSLETQGVIDLITVVDTYNFRVKVSGLYAIVANAVFAYTSGTASGQRAWQLVDAAGTVVVSRSQSAVSNAITSIGGADIVTLDASKTYRMQGKTNDPVGAINCTSRLLTLARFGAGPVGPAGPQGVAGQTGPQGPQGIAGSAASGFATYNAVKGTGADTTTDGLNNTATADQIVPIPTGTSAPHTPFYFKTMAEYLEKRINARFASPTDRNTRRATRVQGEIYTMLDTGTWYVKEKNGNEEYLARVHYSASAPPTGTGQAAPGVIWIQT